MRAFAMRRATVHDAARRRIVKPGRRRLRPAGRSGNPSPSKEALSSVLIRLALYFRPHFFAMAAGLAVSFGVRFLAGMGGSCRFLCYPPVTIAMGLIGGFLGAQLYRSENPLQPVDPGALDG